MKNHYLEVTFRHGTPMAAYLYLPRNPGEKSARTAKVGPGLIIDFNGSGQPIGIEITAPNQTTLPALNEILNEYGVAPLEPADFAPLRAA